MIAGYNTYALTEEATCYFYTDVRKFAPFFLLKVYDGDSHLRIEVLDPAGSLVFSRTGFSDGAWDVFPIPITALGTYTIRCYRTYLPWGWVYNAFHLDVDNDNLYSYCLYLSEETDGNLWVESSGCAYLELTNYDMDGHGRITIYRPDGSLYGIFTGSPYISGDREYADIRVEDCEMGYWHVIFDNLDGARWFEVYAYGYDTISDPIRLETKQPLITTPTVHISTDKSKYAANDTMIINVTLANPMKSSVELEFRWIFHVELENRSVDIPVIKREFKLPEYFNYPNMHPLSISWRLPSFNVSFNASWRIELCSDGVLISEDEARWQYDPPIGLKTPTWAGGKLKEVGDIVTSSLSMDISTTWGSPWTWRRGSPSTTPYTCSGEEPRPPPDER